MIPINQVSKMQTRMLKERNQSTILDMVTQIHGTSSIAKIQTACILAVTMVRALTKKSIHVFAHAHVEFTRSARPTTVFIARTTPALVLTLSGDPSENLSSAALVPMFPTWVMCLTTPTTTSTSVTVLFSTTLATSSPLGPATEFL